MRTRIILAMIGLAALSAALPAQAHTRVGINISLGNAPPPPVIRYRHEPHFAYLPSRRVYVIDAADCDYDYFRYADDYYIFDNGYWYRSDDYSGPFVAIRADYVPRSIYSVSDREYRWRHRPQIIRSERYRTSSRNGDGWGRGGEDEREHGREHGHEHGHGHGNGHGDH